MDPTHGPAMTNDDSPRPGVPAAEAQPIDALLCGLLNEPVACRLLQLTNSEADLLVGQSRVDSLKPLMTSPREAWLLLAMPGSGQPRPLLLRATTLASQGNRIRLRIVGVAGASPPIAQPPLVVAPPATATAARSATASTASPHKQPKLIALRSADAQTLDRFLKTLLAETGTLGEQYFAALARSLLEAQKDEVRPWAQAILRNAQDELSVDNNDRIWALQWGVVSEMSRMVGQQLPELSRKAPPSTDNSEMSLVRTGEMNEMIAIGNVIERLDLKMRTPIFEVARQVGELCGQQIREASNPLAVDRMITRLNDITPDSWTNAMLRPRFFQVLEGDMETALKTWLAALQKVLEWRPEKDAARGTAGQGH